MSCLVSDLVAVAARHLSPELVGSAILAGIVEATNPFFFAQAIVLEVRLAAQESDVDVSICLSDEDVRLGVFRAPPEENVILRDDRWRRVFDWVERWASSESGLRDRVEGVGFELDRPGLEPSLAPPNVFWQTTGEKDEDLQWLLDAIEDLLGALPSPESTRSLFRCVKELPAGRRCSHFALMLPRPEPFLRLVVPRMSHDEVPAYLETMGWPGAMSEIRPVLAFLREHVATLTLAIGLGANVLPGVGFECYFQGLAQGSRGPLLDALVRAGLCTSQKRSAVLEWSGVTPPEEGDSLATLGAFLGPRAGLGYRRCATHVKVVHQPARPLQAKAYLDIQDIVHSQRSTDGTDPGWDTRRSS